MPTTPIAADPSATLTVPADYVIDMRTALVREIAFDSDVLKYDHESTLKNPDLADYESAIASLRHDLDLLERLIGAKDGVELRSARHTLFHALEVMTSSVSDRLAAEMKFAPLDMHAVRELGERLQWAARESIRLFPQLRSELTAKGSR